MSNNVFGGQPNAVVAKSTISFASAGITALNTAVIYLVGNPLLSYIPGRSINGITGFVSGQGYYMVMLTSMDLSSILIPPVTGLTQLATPASLTPTVISSTEIDLAWASVVSATGYVLDRATDAGFTTGVALAIYSSTGTAFNNTGLTASTHYYYRVRATAAGFTDSNYATGNATTSATGPVLEDLLFPTQVSLANVGTVWNGTDTAVNFNCYGLASKKLAAGQNGYIRHTFTASDANAGILAFSTTNTNKNYAAGQYGAAVFFSGGNVWRMDSGGAGTNTGVAVAAGNMIRISRTGSSLTIEKSTDGGATWPTLVYTFTFASAADLFINMNIERVGVLNKVYDPKGFNVS